MNLSISLSELGNNNEYKQRWHLHGYNKIDHTECENMHKCVQLRVYMCLCVFIECGWLQILMAQLWEKEREGVREERIKTNRSNPLKMMIVCLS